MTLITYDKIQAMAIIGDTYFRPAALILMLILIIIIISDTNKYNPTNVRLEDGD